MLSMLRLSAAARVRPSLSLLRAMSSNASPCDGSAPRATIATHDGKFHADEALACFMLKQLPEYRSARVVRTRDPVSIGQADVVVDVGDIYDPQAHRYDHHQATFSHSMSSLRPGKDWKPIRLSSAGLVYHHFGERVLSSVLNCQPQDNVVSVVFDRVYQSFILEVDAIDNGVPVASEPAYDISTDLSSRVSHLMPTWNEESSDEILMQRFEEAVALVGQEFLSKVKYYAQVWWPARSLVLQAVQERSR